LNSLYILSVTVQICLFSLDTSEEQTSNDLSICLNVKTGGDNIYGHYDYYADAFRKPR